MHIYILFKMNNLLLKQFIFIFYEAEIKRTKKEKFINIKVWRIRRSDSDSMHHTAEKKKEMNKKEIWKHLKDIWHRYTESSPLIVEWIYNKWINNQLKI